MLTKRSIFSCVCVVFASICLILTVVSPFVGISLALCFVAVYFSLKFKKKMSGFRTQPKGFATKCLHVGQDPEQWEHKAVVPPLVMSTTFKQPVATGEPIVSQINNVLLIWHIQTG